MKAIELMTRRHSYDQLIQKLTQMGYPPQNIVWTKYAIFFTLYCEEKEEKDLEEFVSNF